MKNKQRGQIQIVQLMGWGLAIATTVVTSIMASNRNAEMKIDVVRTEAAVVKERVATLEEAVKTIKDDNAEIKRDIKTILSKLK